MLETFIKKRFNKKSTTMVAQANEILNRFAKMGYTMTLRQLHYQFVKGNLYENTKQNYKRLGSVMSNARLAGLTDWAHMEDRLRSLERSARWDSPGDIVEACASQYQEDLWAGQKIRPEVWIEKDALAGIIMNVCSELRIDFFACRGYVSQSAQYEAAKRFDRYRRAGQEPLVLHFGDHDPSGIDMTRENKAKFALLCGKPVQVKRLALNMDQVEKYNPPPNFAKASDIRFNGYVEKFGEECWELDALDPDVLEKLIRDSVEPLINRRRWNTAKTDEDSSKDDLRLVAQQWNDIVRYARDNDDGSRDDE